jgi:hypothetical protein
MLSGRRPLLQVPPMRRAGCSKRRDECFCPHLFADPCLELRFLRSPRVHPRPADCSSVSMSAASPHPDGSAVTDRCYRCPPLRRRFCRSRKDCCTEPRVVSQPCARFESPSMAHPSGSRLGFSALSHAAASGCRSHAMRNVSAKHAASSLLPGAYESGRCLGGRFRPLR